MEFKVAVIGIGQMGSGMALRLAESGMDVVGFDIDAGTRVRVAAEGLPVASSMSTALAGRNAILTSLPDSRAVREVWLGADGVVAHAAPGSLLIDLSTIDPGTMREVAAGARARGLEVVDCPVSGSPKEARQGKLVLIAGGSKQAVERAGPLLLALGDTWRHSGEVGTAKVVKIVNNMMSMGNVLVASEAFAVGVAAGVAPEQLYDILSVSGGRSHHFTKRFPNAIAGNFDPGFKMELGEKDLALALDLGRAAHVPTPAASLVRELAAVALADGYRGRDIVAFLAMYNKWAGGESNG